MRASRCLLCNRPLTSSKHIIGRNCKKKYRIDDGHIYVLASLFKRYLSNRNKMAASQIIKEIQNVGMNSLADRLAKKVSQVQIKEKDDYILLRVPPKPKLIIELGKLGFKYNTNNKTAIIPASKKLIMFGILKKNFSGMVVAGPKGLFVL